MSKENRKTQRQTVQIDADTFALVQEITEESGLSKIELVRRAVRFIASLNGLERMEALGVLPKDVKRPDIVALLWERMGVSREVFESLDDIPRTERSQAVRKKLTNRIKATRARRQAREVEDSKAAG